MALLSETGAGVSAVVEKPQRHFYWHAFAIMDESNANYHILNYKETIMMITIANRFPKPSLTRKENDSDDASKSESSDAFILKPTISSPSPKQGIHDPAAKILILVCMALIISAAFVQKGSGHLFFSGLWGKTLLITFQVSLVLFVLTLIWRVVLVIKYRPAPLCVNEKLPTCGVIVPAYNEGRQVLDTLRSIAQSDYPAGQTEHRRR